MEDQKNANQPIHMRKSKWKSFLGKKWAFPAIYIGTAAIILASVMWFQSNLTDSVMDKTKLTEGVTATTPDQEKAAGENHTQEAVPAAGTTPQMMWPVAKEVSYERGMAFFEEEASKDEQQKTLVKHDNTFFPHTGIDLVATDGKPFGVTAALSGKVRNVTNDPLVGNQVEIEHADKLITIYQSLDKVSVKPGDEVTQGQEIGTAGRNVFEKEAGNHLHFEVLVDGNPANPDEYLIQAEAKTQ